MYSVQSREAKMMSGNHSEDSPVEKHTKRVIYIPLKPSIVDRFAQDACKHLAVHDPMIADPEVISGFAAFLNLLAEIVAKRLNEGHDDLLDTPHSER